MVKRAYGSVWVIEEKSGKIKILRLIPDGRSPAFITILSFAPYRLIEKGRFYNYSKLKERKNIEVNPKGKKSLAQIITSNIQWRSQALNVKIYIYFSP